MQIFTPPPAVEQRTPEWHKQRLGKVTASRVGDATARLKNNGYGAGRAAYLMQLVVERLTGEPTAFFENDAMRWGVAQEPFARAAYAAWSGAPVLEVGFIDHPKIAMSGASPDGLVGDDGLIELKCPTTATHIETLLGAAIDAKYIAQMQWQMACTGRTWCDFASYDPRLPEYLRLHVVRVPRDPAAIASLESEIRTFLGEVDAKISALAALAANFIPF